MKFASITLCLVASLTSSCAINYLQLNSAQLQPAIEAYAAQNYELCNDLLSDLDIDDFISAAKPEYAFMSGMSAHHLGKTVESIEKLSGYLEMKNSGAPPARMRVVEEILFDYAKKYIRGEIKTFWIFSTPSNGYLILKHLEHFATNIELQAEAILRSANYYFSERRFIDASNSYSMLLDPRFSSLGWDDRAAYGVANCRYLMLIPGKSDEQSIMYALNEAQSYLANFPAGANRVDALAIAADCVTKIAQLHLTIAQYYATIGNKPGAEYHSKLASGIPKQVATDEVYPENDAPTANSGADSYEEDLILSGQQFVGFGRAWGEDDAE